ncbi:MAG TPA: hypothetical protein VF671_10845, partial [Pseudomonas sp.]|uniref:hypothetical protein n=1 Tax=Pseudomonas sp. TaxID=306 RepID=UPI002ED7EDDF
AQPGMGWPLNLSVIWRQAPRFFKGLTGYTYSEGTGPLEKSAALYQKGWHATTGNALCLCISQAVQPSSGAPAGTIANLPLVVLQRLF